ncbi:hypothetical protein [Prosthecobacter sp.]|uniref:hypothetical protein n=1 Tax=Prosthecobacter sp. TaxID=1965333 RepID=UPI00248A7A54|nr:hypothetical protein [Prosthecobacter sp.]MDI1310936.1 hypothetical protein [Prosthecobacter sp.]
MREFDYQRLVIGYHGCDASVRDKVIQKGGQLQAFPKSYDWLGHGIYFWEHGPARALEWARAQKKRGKLKTPAVLGAVLHLGSCFDLLDAEYTDVLTEAYPLFEESIKANKTPRPSNKPLNKTDKDQLLRKLDCAVVNWTIEQLEKDGKAHFHSVRGVFQEGDSVFPESGIRRRSHIQIAVRDPACILGYFQSPSQR